MLPADLLAPFLAAAFWLAPLADGGGIQALIDGAIATKAPRVALPQGTFVLDRNLRVEGAQGLTIEGPRTTLVFRSHEGIHLGVRRCTGITLKGFTMDCDPLPFTQGTIAAAAPDRSWYEFQVHAGYPDLTPDFLNTTCHLFEADRPRWKREAPDVYPRKIVALGPRRGRMEVNPAASYYDRIAVGDRLVLNKRTGGSIRFDQCENIAVEGVTILAGPGAAVLPRYVKGNNRYQFDIRPGPPPPGATQPRLMSTCADGFNSAFDRHGPTLEGCHFSFMGDDSVNLHGILFLAVEAVSPTEILVARPYRGEPLQWLLEPGDSLRRLAKGDYLVLGEAPLEGVRIEPQATPAQVEVAHAAWPRLDARQLVFYRVALRAPLAVQAGEFLDVPAVAAPHFTVRDCEFRDHRARGLRIQAPHGVIERNVFRRIKQSAISLGPEYAFWRESGWVEDVVVRGNAFEDVCQSPFLPNAYALGAISLFARCEPANPPLAPPPGNRNISIEGNTLVGCSLAAVHAYATEGLTVRDNRFARTSYRAWPDAGAAYGLRADTAIATAGAARVTVEGNQVREEGVAPIP